MLGFLLEQGSADRWLFRRHPAVTRPLHQLGRTTADGVPFVAPEVALLFKAKLPRFKDQRDFDRVLPHLDGPRGRGWPGPWNRPIPATPGVLSSEPAGGPGGGGPQLRLPSPRRPAAVPHARARGPAPGRPRLRGRDALRRHRRGAQGDAVLAVELFLDVLVRRDGITQRVYNQRKFDQPSGRAGWVTARRGRQGGLEGLTACRVWRFAEDGRHASKTAAAEWALERDPTLGVVGDALGRGLGDPAAHIDPAQVARLLAEVRARLAEARDRAWLGHPRW
jgi:Domain of unknown function (DUF4111)